MGGVDLLRQRPTLSWALYNLIILSLTEYIYSLKSVLFFFLFSSIEVGMKELHISLDSILKLMIHETVIQEFVRQ